MPAKQATQATPAGDYYSDSIRLNSITSIAITLAGTSSPALALPRGPLSPVDQLTAWI